MNRYARKIAKKTDGTRGLVHRNDSRMLVLVGVICVRDAYIEVNRGTLI